MRQSRRLARLCSAVALAAIVGTTATACGEEPAEVQRASSRKIEMLEAATVPGEINGLEVAKEDISKIFEDAKRPYLDGVALFSLREGDKLQATFQVGRFSDDARYKDGSFRRSLLSTLGAGSPRKLRMEDQEVFLMSGDRQQMAVWFRDDHMFVLSAREDYKYPRALLRRTLEVQI